MTTNNATVTRRAELNLRRDEPETISKTRLQLLDCIRAVACLAVVYDHAGAPMVCNKWGWGTYAVSIFCALSGFLLTSLLLEEEKKNSKLDVVYFLQRRALRILPCYFVTIFLTLLGVSAGIGFRAHPEVVDTIVGQLPRLLTFTFHQGGPGMLIQMWSLSIEEQFYCFLPLFLLLARTRAQRCAGLLLLSLVLIFSTKAGPTGAPAFLPLAAGALLAVLQARTPFASINRKFAFSAAALLLICTVLLGWSPFGPAAAIAFAVVVWLASQYPVHHKLLAPIAYVGRISYCIYLIQFPVICADAFVLRRLNLDAILWCRFLMASAVSIAIASLSWRYFETPILNLRNSVRQNPWGIAIAFISPALIAIGFLLQVLGMLH